MVEVSAHRQAAPGRLDALQGLRAVAALMVVAFHLHVYTMPDVLGAGRLWGGFSMGYSGVEIFFVLSGFIMVFVHRKDFGRPERTRAFLRKRIVRIYPFFWAMLVATVALRALVNGAESLPSLRAFFVSVFLWPDFSEPIIEVAWSLSYEMLFYVVFAVAILNLRLGIATGALWFGATAAAALTGYEGEGAQVLLSAYNLLFLFGIAAGFGFSRLGRLAGPALLAGAALFLAVGLSEALGGTEWNKALRTVLYGAGATGIVAGLASLDAAGRLRTPRLLAFLGDASYAIYLVHLMAMTVAAKVMLATGMEALLPPWASAALLFAAAAVAGSLAHLLVERPLLGYLRRGKRQASADVRRAGA